jgi:LacI family transcriptional regulator
MAGDSKLFTSQKRVSGYRDVVKAAGLPYLAEVEVNDRDSVRAALARHWTGKDKVDGIFCIKNALTVHTFQVLHEMGISIPGAVSLIGFDDFELADALHPPITVMRQPVMDIAKRAAEMLFDAMETGQQRQSTVTLKVEMVHRGSCCSHMSPARGVGPRAKRRP